MKRSMIFAVAICALITVASTASAGNRHRGNQQQNNSGTVNKFFDNSGNSQFPGQSFGTYLPSTNQGGSSDIVSKFKKHHGHKHDDPKPLDPGRGDGRVPVNPPPTGPVVQPPQGRPGYIFVDGHWERARANQGPMNPLPTGPVVQPPQGRPGYVFVDGHWERAKANQGPTLVANPNLGQPTVRDHRSAATPPMSSGNGAGGVTVSDTQSSAPRPGYGWRYRNQPPPIDGNTTVTVTDPTKPPRDTTIRGYGLTWEDLGFGFKVDAPPPIDWGRGQKANDHRSKVGK